MAFFAGNASRVPVPPTPREDADQWMEHHGICWYREMLDSLTALIERHRKEAVQQAMPLVFYYERGDAASRAAATEAAEFAIGRTGLTCIVAEKGMVGIMGSPLPDMKAYDDECRRKYDTEEQREAMFQEALAGSPPAIPPAGGWPEVAPPHVCDYQMLLTSKVCVVCGRPEGPQ